MHDKFPQLNLARIEVPDSGTEKFLLASASSRGIALPIVTLLMLDCPSVETRFVIVHPALPPSPQVEPVKPFVQIHEQLPWEITLVPPFRQGSLCWH